MPPENDVPPSAEAAEVEELDANDLVADGAETVVTIAGVFERALEDAAHSREDAARARRIRFYENEIEALGRGEPEKARVALYQHEIGELLEVSGDEGAAVKAYAKAIQSDATLKPNLWAIRRVFQRRALWPNLLKLLDAEIRFAKDPVERAELLVEKGHLLEDKLAQPAQAKECYLAACEAEPASLAAWMALEKIYLQDGDLAGQARACRGLADATAEPGRKMALLVDLARLEETGGSVDRALELLREAFAVPVAGEMALDAARARVLDELERVADRAGRLEDKLWALDARIELVAAEAARLGVAERIEANDQWVAVLERAHGVALGLDSPEGGARAWAYLARALEVAPMEPFLVRDLAEAAETLGRWEDLAAVLQRKLEGASLADRVALQFERAEAFRHAGKVAEAEACEAEVLREAPGHLGVLVQREREALRAGDWDRLAGLYLAEADLAAAGRTPTETADPVWAATARTQAGVLYAERVGSGADAQAAFERALEIAPGFRPAVDALERLYTRHGKHAEHAALLERELEAKPNPGRAQRLLETLIAVRESGLDDPAGAAQAARRLVELRPDDARVRSRLVELDRTAGRWAETAEDLAGLARVVSDERRLDALLERAEILERRLGDDAAAAAVYKEALQLRPGEPRAAEPFEAISRRRQGKPDSGPHEQPTPPAWDDLAQALKREADASLSPERIVGVLLKLGEIHERERGNWTDAAKAYRDLLDRSPGQPAALRGLERAYAALGDEVHRAEVMEQEVEAPLDPRSRAILLVELGELYEDKLKKDDLADDAFTRALTSGGEPAAHAAFGRFRAAVRRRDPGPIARSFTELAALLPAGTPARGAILDERAAIERAGGGAEAALATVKEALAEAPSALATLLRARLAAQAGDSRELAAALETLAEQVTDPRLQATLERRAGTLGLGAGGSHELAEARLKRAQLRLPADADTVIALCDVALDEAALAHRIPLSQGAAQLEWIVERAESLESAGRLAEAAREAARALGEDPRHLPALELMRRLARAGGDLLGYARASVRLGAQLQESERAAMLYAEAAQTFEHIAELESAASAWRAVLDRTPLDGTAFARARELLQARYRERKEAGPLLELYTHRLAHVEDALDRVGLLEERAELCEREGDRAGAERDLRAILAGAPAHPQATRRLAEVLAVDPRAEARAEALALYRRFLDLEAESEPKRAARVRMAELEEASGHLEQAVEHLEAAVDLAPSREQAVAEVERIAELLKRQRKWARAVEELQRVVPLKQGAERAAVEVRIADLYRQGLSDPRAAALTLLRALGSEPLELDALARLVELAEGGHVVQLQLDERLERAVAEARARLKADPAQAYQALVRLHAWRADEDARIVAAQAHAWVTGQPLPSRESAIDPARELSPAGWERLLPESARGVALELWRAAGEVTQKVLGPTVESLGVAKGDRVNAKGPPTAWLPVDKVARALGVASYELFVSRDRDACAAAGLQLVCGMAFADKLQPRTRFRVARRLALARDRLAVLERIADDELGVFLAAAVRGSELPPPPSLARFEKDARFEASAKAFAKAAGRKERKAIGALAPRLAELVAPAEWRRAVLEGATRVALVVGGDLAAAFDELGLASGDPAASELVELATSEEFLVLRREMGLRG